MTKRKSVLSEQQMQDRLIHMGLMSDTQSVSPERMPVFATIYTDLFLWDMKNSGIEKQAILSAHEAFQKLSQEEDYINMYLLLSLQYDNMRKPLPEPVWWLMCCDAAVHGFMKYFFKSFSVNIRQFIEAGSQAGDTEQT